MAVRAAVPVAHMFEKFLSRFRRRSLCKSRTGELPAMVVRAANKNLFPCLCVCRREIMAICEFLDFFRRQLVEQRLGQIAQKCIAQTVDALEMLEKKNEHFKMTRIEFAVDTVKGMRDGMRDLGHLQVTL